MLVQIEKVTESFTTKKSSHQGLHQRLEYSSNWFSVITQANNKALVRNYLRPDEMKTPPSNVNLVIIKPLSVQESAGEVPDVTTKRLKSESLRIEEVKNLILLHGIPSRLYTIALYSSI